MRLMKLDDKRTTSETRGTWKDAITSDDKINHLISMATSIMKQI